MSGIQHITHKNCRICQQRKPVDEFHKLKKWYASYCKVCQSEFYKLWRSENKESIKKKSADKFKKMPEEIRFNNHIKQRYGITSDEYLEMLEQQNGVCKICHEPSQRKRLSVDHCHDTGKVRGLLCERCNSVLGRVKDSVLILENAANYLKDI